MKVQRQEGNLGSLTCESTPQDVRYLAENSSTAAYDNTNIGHGSDLSLSCLILSTELAVPRLTQELCPRYSTSTALLLRCRLHGTSATTLTRVKALSLIPLKSQVSFSFHLIQQA